MNVVHSRMKKNQTRRTFLKVAPVAAAASIPLTKTLLFAASPGTGDSHFSSPGTVQLFTAGKLADAVKTFQAQLGEHYLYQPKDLPLTIAMTIQGEKIAKDFEYHEGRDHIFLFLDGATKFEVGGTPKDARNTRPGEWLAPASDGATLMEVKKGDMLVIPRNTPHRQSTETSVTWVLISPSGSMTA
jgi:mannose-6-phosphate isomerase-like protein (cupin superfamily)